MDVPIKSFISFGYIPNIGGRGVPRERTPPRDGHLVSLGLKQWGMVLAEAMSVPRCGGPPLNA